MEQKEKPSAATNKWNCSFCEKSYCQKPALNLHVGKIHSGSIEKNLKCDECPKLFYTKAELNVHFQRMHGSMKKSHQCTECPKMFFQVGDMKAHVKGVHLKIKDIPCPHCERGFS